MISGCTVICFSPFSPRNRLLWDEILSPDDLGGELP